MGLANSIGDDRFVLKLPDVKRARYYIEAVARDGSGLVSKAVVQIKVSSLSNIRIATPRDGTILLANESIQIVVNATDPNGFIRDVEIYANNTLIEHGPVMIPGKYVFVWRKVPLGEYVLKAVAIDDVGVAGESNQVNLKIETKVLSP